MEETDSGLLQYAGVPRTKRQRSSGGSGAGGKPGGSGVLEAKGRGDSRKEQRGLLGQSS